MPRPCGRTIMEDDFSCGAQKLHARKIALAGACRILQTPEGSNNRQTERASSSKTSQRPVFAKLAKESAASPRQIIETALHLSSPARFYENTRIDVISCIRWRSSQPTFFRYFPSKDAVLPRKWDASSRLCSPGRKPEIRTVITKATTEQRLRRFYETLGNVTEVGRPLWQAR